MRLILSLCACLFFPQLLALEPIKNAPELEALLQQINHSSQGKMPHTTRFYLVRHGESQANKERFLAGQTLDVDLTAHGEEQARAIGSQLKHYQEDKLCFDAAFSSPRIRTRKTGHLILSYCPCPPSLQEDPRLLERHSGKFEGKAMDGAYYEMKKKGEAELELLPTFEEKFAYKFDVKDDLEESHKEVWTRTNAFLQEKHQALNTQGKDILVTTHNGVMKALFMHQVATQFHKELPYSLFSLANCGLMIVDVNDTNLHLVYVEGVTFHPPPLSSTSALSLYDQAFPSLSSVLDKEERDKIYAGDKEFIAQFPFTEYPLVEVALQGKFFIDRIDDSIKNRLRQGQPWEEDNKALIEKYAQPGTLALDIGSHMGTHTVTMARAVGAQGRVFAFEPNKKIFRELCLNLAVNHITNVYPLRCALGKERGVIQTITSHPGNEGGSYVVKESGGSNTASIIRLDDLNLANISFIKIDVENMEEEVLEGASQTILRCKPVMLIEIQGNGERPSQLGENSEEMGKRSRKKIENLGYQLKKVGWADYLALPN